MLMAGMLDLDPETIRTTIREVKSDVAAGQVVLEGGTAMQRNAIVNEVCRRLGQVYAECSAAVYDALRSVEAEG